MKYVCVCVKWYWMTMTMTIKTFLLMSAWLGYIILNIYQFLRSKHFSFKLLQMFFVCLTLSQSCHVMSPAQTLVRKKNNFILLLLSSEFLIWIFGRQILYKTEKVTKKQREKFEIKMSQKNKIYSFVNLFRIMWQIQSPNPNIFLSLQ